MIKSRVWLLLATFLAAATASFGVFPVPANPALTVKYYENPQKVSSSFYQNPFLNFPDTPTFETSQDNEAYSISLFPERKVFVYELTGFYHAISEQVSFLALNCTKAYIQLGYKPGVSGQSSGDFRELLSDEYIDFNNWTAPIDLESKTYYPIRITLISASTRVRLLHKVKGGKAVDINSVVLPEYRKVNMRGTQGYSWMPKTKSRGLLYRAAIAPNYSPQYNKAMKYMKLLSKMSSGRSNLAFDGSKVPKMKVRYAMEILGSFQVPQSGNYTFDMSARHITVFQVGRGTKEKSNQHKMGSMWDLLDGRMDRRGTHILRRGLYYPFRLIVLAGIHDHPWDMHIYGPQRQRIDLFGLWDLPPTSETTNAQMSDDVTRYLDSTVNDAGFRDTSTGFIKAVEDDFWRTVKKRRSKEKDPLDASTFDVNTQGIESTLDTSSPQTSEENAEDELSGVEVLGEEPNPSIEPEDASAWEYKHEEQVESTDEEAPKSVAEIVEAKFVSSIPEIVHFSSLVLEDEMSQGEETETSEMWSDQAYSTVSENPEEKITESSAAPSPDFNESFTQDGQERLNSTVVNSKKSDASLNKLQDHAITDEGFENSTSNRNVEPSVQTSVIAEHSAEEKQFQSRSLDDEESQLKIVGDEKSEFPASSITEERSDQSEMQQITHVGVPDVEVSNRFTTSTIPVEDEQTEILRDTLDNFNGNNLTIEYNDASATSGVKNAEEMTISVAPSTVSTPEIRIVSNPLERANSPPKTHEGAGNPLAEPFIEKSVTEPEAKDTLGSSPSNSHEVEDELVAGGQESNTAHRDKMEVSLYASQNANHTTPDSEVEAKEPGVKHETVASHVSNETDTVRDQPKNNAVLFGAIANVTDGPFDTPTSSMLGFKKELNETSFKTAEEIQLPQADIDQERQYGMAANESITLSAAKDEGRESSLNVTEVFVDEGGRSSDLTASEGHIFPTGNDTVVAANDTVFAANDTVLIANDTVVTENDTVLTANDTVLTANDTAVGTFNTSVLESLRESNVQHALKVEIASVEAKALSQTLDESSHNASLDYFMYYGSNSTLALTNFQNQTVRSNVQPDEGVLSSFFDQTEVVTLHEIRPTRHLNLSYNGQLDSGSPNDRRSKANQSLAHSREGPEYPLSHTYRLNQHEKAPNVSQHDAYQTGYRSSANSDKAGDCAYWRWAAKQIKDRASNFPLERIAQSLLSSDSIIDVENFASGLPSRTPKISQEAVDTISNVLISNNSIHVDTLGSRQAGESPSRNVLSWISGDVLAPLTGSSQTRECDMISDHSSTEGTMHERKMTFFSDFIHTQSLDSAPNSETAQFVAVAVTRASIPNSIISMLPSQGRNGSGTISTTRTQTGGSANDDISSLLIGDMGGMRIHLGKDAFTTLKAVESRIAKESTFVSGPVSYTSPENVAVVALKKIKSLENSSSEGMPESAKELPEKFVEGPPEKSPSELPILEATGSGSTIKVSSIAGLVLFVWVGLAL